MNDLASDMACVSQPATDAIAVLARRRAADRIAAFAITLPRITLKLTEHFDWEQLRANVAHLVSPQLVKFKEPSHG